MASLSSFHTDEAKITKLFCTFGGNPVNCEIFLSQILSFSYGIHTYSMDIAIHITTSLHVYVYMVQLHRKASKYI